MANKQNGNGGAKGMDINTLWGEIRRTSTPLVLATTPDPGALVQRLLQLVMHEIDLRTGQPEPEAPVMQWDAARGLWPLTEAGSAVLPTMLNAVGMQLVMEQGRRLPDQTVELRNTLLALEHLPRRGCVFILNAQKQWNDPVILQALWNLRDQNLQDRRTLVLVAPLGATVPSELEFDVIGLHEPMPTAAELATLATREASNCGVTLDAEGSARAADALCGLSAFTASQALAMTLKATGLDIPSARQLRDEFVGTVPGLSVQDTSTLNEDDIAGYDVIKAHFKVLRRAKRRPRAVILLDEGDKQFAGTGVDGAPGDSNGLKGDQLSVMLHELDGARPEEQQDGALFMGHPGTGKTAIARIIAAMLGVTFLHVDLGACLNSYAGESQARIRQLLSVARAVSGGQALWIMTANSLTNLPPELRRRFDSQDMWFFDLPSVAERAAIWRLYIAKYGLTPKAMPSSIGGKKTFDDTDWTGAEIRKACFRSWNTGIDLDEAAATIVPLALSDATGVGRRRAEANGRYRSPSAPGPYKLPAGLGVQQVKGRDVALAAATLAATAGVRDS